MNHLEIKQELLSSCYANAEDRRSKILSSIKSIEESMFEESKSSSGDKYETGRSMLQIDRENAGKQLKEVEALIATLNKVNISATSNYARLGSLVVTNHFTYFISISIGAISVHDLRYLCIALNSPIGQLLNGKRVGEEFSFNGMQFIVENIS